MLSPRPRDTSIRRSLCAPSSLCLIFLTIASLLGLAAAQEKTAADYFVSSLPGAPEPLLRMYAGHVEISSEHNGNIFFWLYKNRHIANRQRTVIWLNGGPGCSSMDGALMEIGPYRINPDGTLRLNDGSWDEFANILFVDNPVGTGFSYVDGDSLVHELGEMSAQMMQFLEKFFAIFPEHAQDDLYIAGESYAGQHIPYIASAMLDRNALMAHDLHWNLSGLMIGNGWISAPEQYLSYIPFAYESGVLQSGTDAAKYAVEQEKRCIKDLDNGGKDHVDVSSCEQVLQEILRLTPRNGECINMYDVRVTDSECGMKWPPDLAQMAPYLRREDVLKALHIDPAKKSGWVECNNQVSAAFRAANSKPSKTLLPGLLEKIPIILFSGDQDLICNHLGTEDLISKLEWNGAVGMETSPGMTAPKRDWTVEGEPAGTWQTARNLTYIRFYNSSHMVPFDYPRRTRDMLDRFIGVDIASIGGTPADSRIDGEKGIETSVGGHPNSTAAQQAEKEKLQSATWKAYQRSGELALVVVVAMVVSWGFFLWRDRRRRRGYKGLFGSDPYDGGDRLMAGGLELDESGEDRDIEAAADFDEARLPANGRQKEMEKDRFGLADDEDEEDHGSSQRHT